MSGVFIVIIVLIFVVVWLVKWLGFVFKCIGVNGLKISVSVLLGVCERVVVVDVEDVWLVFGVIVG